jgi:phosphatidylglycerophosphate synthase
VSYDGLVSRTLNRPLSRPMARGLSHTPVTPNMTTAFTLLLAMITTLLIATGFQAIGGIGIQVVSVIDGVDGELARLKNQATRFGAIFDAVSDRYADALMLGGMTIYAVRFEGHPHAEAIGMLALAGSLIISYSRARIEASMGAEAVEARGHSADLVFGLASRDVRSLIAAIGTVAGQCYITLIVLAVMCGVTIAWRLAYLRWAGGRTTDKCIGT